MISTGDSKVPISPASLLSIWPQIRSSRRSSGTPAIFSYRAIDTSARVWLRRYDFGLFLSPPTIHPSIYPPVTILRICDLGDRTGLVRKRRAYKRNSRLPPNCPPGINHGKVGRSAGIASSRGHVRPYCVVSRLIVPLRSRNGQRAPWFIALVMCPRETTGSIDKFLSFGRGRDGNCGSWGLLLVSKMSLSPTQLQGFNPISVKRSWSL